MRIEPIAKTVKMITRAKFVNLNLLRLNKSEMIVIHESRGIRLHLTMFVLRSQKRVRFLDLRLLNEKNGVNRKKNNRVIFHKFRRSLRLAEL